MRAAASDAQVVDPGRFAAGELGVFRLVAPGDERGEPSGFILQIAEPQQVLQPFFVGLHRAVHHRRRGAKPGSMCVAHHVEPFVGGGLAVAVQQLPHSIHQDLGAAARYAVEARGNQALDDLAERQLG